MDLQIPSEPVFLNDNLRQVVTKIRVGVTLTKHRHDMPKLIVLTGKRFGRLTVLDEHDLRPIGKKGDRKTYWKCQCDCGNECWVISGSLISGNTRSCGCLYIDIRPTCNRTHGLSGTKVYLTWSNMQTRCYCPSADHYAEYGGRGIKVCYRWRKSFENFLEDMGQPPSSSYSLERIDVNGDYDPGNCIWIPVSEQNFNTRRTVRDPDGVPVAKFIHENGLKYKYVINQVRNGMRLSELV